MSMLSGSGLGQGDGRRRRHPLATGFLIVAMMAVLFGATFGAIRLIKGDGGAEASASSGSPTPCVSTTVTPGAALPKPATVTANVYNATDRAGLGARDREHAQDARVRHRLDRERPLGQVAHDDRRDPLRHQGKDNALLMRYYIVGATLVPDQRTDATIDVVLGAKYKAIPDQKVINAALAKPVVVASGAGCPTPTKSGTAKPASKSPEPLRLTPQRVCDESGVGSYARMSARIVAIEATNATFIVTRRGSRRGGSRGRRRRPSPAGWSSW